VDHGETDPGRAAQRDAGTDRRRLRDRWGNQWVIAQHVKDLSPAEMKKAQDEFVASRGR